jgi:hypothetical protein
METGRRPLRARYRPVPAAPLAGSPRSFTMRTMTTLLAPDGDALGAPAAAPEEAVPAPAGGSAGPAHVPLDEIVPTPLAASIPERPAPAVSLAPGMRTARVTGVSGRRARITLRGQSASVDAAIAPEVDPSVVTEAVENGDSVLVETVEGEPPLLVAVLHTRRPRTLRLKAATIEIEGEEEVLVRSGRGALRIRADGDIEVVGSRISAASRGLFRIVGRILRLN